MTIKEGACWAEGASRARARELWWVSILPSQSRAQGVGKIKGTEALGKGLDVLRHSFKGSFWSLYAKEF